MPVISSVKRTQRVQTMHRSASKTTRSENSTALRLWFLGTSNREEPLPISKEYSCSLHSPA